jgi:hypothetical protein
LIATPEAALYRGVTVAAPIPTVFRWLCQLRAAPYSYDWIDNRGRTSPPQLIEGLERLAIGQDVMRIFTLVAFATDDHLTFAIKGRTSAHRLFGDLAGSYQIVPHVAGACRLLVKLIARYPRGRAGRAMGWLLPWGDLVMMRRQLLNLKGLAERSAQ